MPELTLIQHVPQTDASGNPNRRVKLSASRATLAKRRWRGCAEDGREFGFDLDHPVGHGATFLVEGDAHYVIDQEPEEMIEIMITSVEQAAHVAWSLGNLHFLVQVLPHAVRVMPDPAVLQFINRTTVPHHRLKCVFLPLAAESHHHHD